MRRTIVILHPGGLGDLLLAVPAVQSLRSRFPAHDVVVCGHDEASRFLAECGLVDHSLPVHTTACAPLFAGRTPDDPLLVDWLGRCDRAVAWTKDDCGTLSAVLKRSGAVESVVQSPFAATLTGVHQSERYAEILGVEAGQVPVVDIVLPEALKGEARELLASCGFFHEQRLALVHPGSGSRHKCMKPEILGRVLGGLQAQGFEPLILQGPADEEIVDGLLAHVPPRRALLRGLPLRLVAGVLSQVDLFLGHDSGVTHLAALLGTVTVALFGPTAPARWAPRGRTVTVVTGKSCVCPTWETIKDCQEKPCLNLSSSTILDACLTMRGAELNPRIC
jgi:ADP-heptose:LPS heptosyltransferase